MAIALRPIEPADVPEAGRICHDAFKAIAGQHNFPPDFPEPEVAINLLSRLTANLGFYGVVAEQDGGSEEVKRSRLPSLWNKND